MILVELNLLKKFLIKFIPNNKNSFFADDYHRIKILFQRLYEKDSEEIKNNLILLFFPIN